MAALNGMVVLIEGGLPGLREALWRAAARRCHHTAGAVFERMGGYARASAEAAAVTRPPQSPRAGKIWRREFGRSLARLGEAICVAPRPPPTQHDCDTPKIITCRQ